MWQNISMIRCVALLSLYCVNVPWGPFTDFPNFSSVSFSAVLLGKSSSCWCNETTDNQYTWKFSLCYNIIPNWSRILEKLIKLREMYILYYILDQCVWTRAYNARCSRLTDVMFTELFVRNIINLKLFVYCNIQDLNATYSFSPVTIDPRYVELMCFLSSALTKRTLRVGFFCSISCSVKRFFVSLSIRPDIRKHIFDNKAAFSVILTLSVRPRAIGLEKEKYSRRINYV